MLAHDGLTNVVASLATGKDKAAATSWFVQEHVPEVFEAMYRSGWLGRKIIDIPTDDMVRRWRTWSADDALVEQIEAVEKRFFVRQKMAQAVRWGRLFGASAIILGVDPRLGDPSQPLDTASMRPGDLKYLHVDVHPRLTIREWDTDIASSGFGRPRMYLYQPVVRGGAGGQVQIHASRVIPFSGMALPPFAAQRTDRWGDSVFTAIEQTLNTAASTTAVIASLLLETKVDIIKTDLSGIGTPEGEARLKARFSLATMLKSVNNTLLMGADESYEQKTITFAGLSDIHIRMMQEISGAADIPVTRLLGQTPAGLGSTGESDLRNYYDAISAKQENDLRGPLERLDALLFANDGIKIGEDGAFFGFTSLWQESSSQKAENAYKRAQAAKLIVDTGLIDDEVMKPSLISQLIEDGTYPALDAEVKRVEALDTPDDEDDIAGDLVTDAAPRTLYVSRKVENAAEILTWARGQGISSTLAASDLHVTIAYSRKAVDWFAVGTDQDKILIPRGGPRMMERFGEKGEALVLMFSDWSLQWRHERLCEAGASWDYESYQPHITIAKDAEAVDLGKVEPYQGKIVLGPEIFAETD